MTEWVLVTGGAKGLGRSICLELAAHGYNVLVHYYQSENEARTVADQCCTQGVEAAVVQGDLQTSEGVNFLIEEVNKRDYFITRLVNNVGNYLIKPASKTEENEWRVVFETNLHAPFLLTKAFCSSLTEGKGAVINIGVVGLNRLAADTYSSGYTIAKQGLLNLTRSFAKELAPSGITVNMVSPGHLETSVDIPDDKEKLPMKKPVKLHEVSRLIAFLVDSKNHSITGQNIEVGGAVRL